MKEQTLRFLNRLLNLIFQIGIKYFFIFIIIFSGCLNLNMEKSYMKEKEKQISTLKVYDSDKIPDTLKYKVLGKVHGYDSSKNGMNINSANLDMKRNALKKYGSDVDAIISTQYSYYGGYYGKGGTNAYGLAIKILQE